ncbi:MAG: poly-gamma-glutamate system protein [Vicinamibacterales bacterium]
MMLPASIVRGRRKNKAWPLAANERFIPRTGLVRVPLPVLAAIAAGLVALASAGGSGPPYGAYPPLSIAGRPGAAGAPVARAVALAEETVRKAESAVASAKRAAGLIAPPEAGANASSLIGDELTPLVTTLGSLEAKRLSADPRWVHALVPRLAAAGIGEGSFVAAGFSGSFPALNVAVAAACQALGADIAAVSSVTASTWGANQPGFTWPEIERLLVREGILRRVSIAVTMGGSEDRALDLDDDGRRLAAGIMEQVARDLGIPAFVPVDFQSAVTRRMELYDEAREGRPVSLYVNIGGTEASMGQSMAILRQGSGFLPGVPFDFSRGRGVVARFAERGVPVLMLLNIRGLALRWGIPSSG